MAYHMGVKREQTIRVGDKTTLLADCTAHGCTTCVDSNNHVVDIHYSPCPVLKEPPQFSVGSPPYYFSSVYMSYMNANNPGKWPLVHHPIYFGPQHMHYSEPQPTQEQYAVLPEGSQYRCHQFWPGVYPPMDKRK